MHHVDAEIARPGDAEDGVHVGAVEVDQGARGVHQLGDGRDLLVEQAERVRVGDHEHGGALVELGLEVVEIDQAAGVALDGDGVEAGDGGAGGVGAVGAVGDEDARALLAPVAEVGGGDQQGGQLALGAGGRLQRDGVQAGDLGQDVLHLPEQFAACPGRTRRLAADAGWPCRAAPPAARAAWGCTSWYTTRADRNWCRSTCSASTG